MNNITYSQTYISVVDDEGGKIVTEHGSCYIPDEEQIEEIIEILNISDNCKMDYYEYEGMPYISFVNKSNWKVKYYTYCLFTLKPTKTSPIQRTLPKEIADQLKVWIKYEPVKKSSFKDLTPTKEQMTQSLVSAKPDDWGFLLVKSTEGN